MGSDGISVEERFGVDLLIAAEARLRRENLFRERLTEERVRDLVGLDRHIDVRKALRIDRLCEEPRVHQRDLIVRIVRVVRHFEIDLAVLPRLAGVEHGGVFRIQRLDVLDRRRSLHDEYASYSGRQAQMSH